MAHVVRIPNMQVGLKELCKLIRDEGEEVAPRGEPTLEVNDVVIELEDVYSALPTGINRKLNSKFGAVEALQVIGGFCDPKLMVAANPGMKNFMNDHDFHGAYGPRISSQVPLVVDRLRADASSRRALIQVWDWQRDLKTGDRENEIRDYPCTSMVALRLRNDKLDASVIFRSNDVWWGISYDLFMWTQFQISVANVLGVEPGRYSHHSLSLHMYTRDIEASLALTDPTEPPLRLAGIGTPGIDVTQLQVRAWWIAQGWPGGPYTESEEWYREQMRKCGR